MRSINERLTYANSFSHFHIPKTKYNRHHLHERNESSNREYNDNRQIYMHLSLHIHFIILCVDRLRLLNFILSFFFIIPCIPCIIMIAHICLRKYGKSGIQLEKLFRQSHWFTLLYEIIIIIVS